MTHPVDTPDPDAPDAPDDGQTPGEDSPQPS